MAKKKPVTTSLAAVSGSAEIPLIEVPPGGTLTVGVDVGPMSIPYTVAYAGRTLIKSLVDRVADAIPLEPGDRVLGWAFAHTEKAWHHRIGISLNSGPVRILERKSEDNKDPDHSVGVAIVRALLLILALCIPTRSALAQSTAALDAKIHERWKAIVTEVEGAQRKSLTAAATTPEERQAIYREVIDRISYDFSALKKLFAR
jgi:Na+-transporting methylmalonyl-CoA/oxaloacetate decarboxylase gamma subunit